MKQIITFVATDIPLDDQGVMSLFHDTSALGITPDDIGGCPVGCLGIPEFGTDFVIQMVVDTKPKTLIGSDPYLRSVSRNGCMAEQCAGSDQERQGNDFYSNLYPR